MNQTQHADLLRRAATFARTIFEMETGEEPDSILIAEAYALSLALDDAALEVETKTIYLRLEEALAEAEEAEALKDTQRAADELVRKLLGDSN